MSCATLCRCYCLVDVEFCCDMLVNAFILFPVHRYLMYKVYKVAFYIPSTNDLELVSGFNAFCSMHLLLQEAHVY